MHVTHETGPTQPGKSRSGLIELSDPGRANYGFLREPKMRCCSLTVRTAPLHHSCNEPRDLQPNILHSGSRYTAHDMAAACVAHGLRRTMGATGINAGTNVSAESLWSSFKHECHHQGYTFAMKTRSDCSSG